MKRGILAAFTMVGALALILGALINVGSAAATNVKSVTVCFESGWDHSDSKPFDSEVVKEQYTDDGLKIAVAGPAEKQSGYVLLAAPVKLSSINQSDTQLQYQLNSGYPPAYQMTTFTDSTMTTWSGNLVYEDGKWWATRAQNWPLMPLNGNGKPVGTLEEWKTAYPNAVVYQVGFSLGSGASASDGTIKSLTFQGTMWVFKGSCGTTTTPPTSTTTTAPTSTTTTTAPTSTTSPTSTTGSPTSTSKTSTTPDEVFYADCEAVIKAGKAPIERGTPGFRPALDRDGDGLGCELEERVGNVQNANNDGSSGNLASTGVSSTTGVLVGLGSVLLIGGVLTLFIVRRRRAPSDS